MRTTCWTCGKTEIDQIPPQIALYKTLKVHAIKCLSPSCSRYNILQCAKCGCTLRKTEVEGYTLRKTEVEDCINCVAPEPVNDAVNHPIHYKSIPIACVKCKNIIEAIDITEHFCGNLANVIKYIWRHEYKGDPIQDLKKAQFYLNREIDRLSNKIELNNKN